MHFVRIVRMCHVFVTRPALIGLSGSVNLPPVASFCWLLRSPASREDRLLVGRARWTTMGIALALLSVGSTLNPLPGAAATEGRVLRRPEALGGTPNSPEPNNLGARESVGETFSLLAARSGGSSPAQLYPTPDTSNGVR